MLWLPPLMHIAGHPECATVTRPEQCSACMQDFHLVTAQKEVIEKFHWLHNKDEHPKVGVWCPISFADAPDCTKRRTILYSSQLHIPAWLQKVLGAPAPCHAITVVAKAQAHAPY